MLFYDVFMLAFEISGYVADIGTVTYTIKLEITLSFKDSIPKEELMLIKTTIGTISKALQ